MNNTPNPTNLYPQIEALEDSLDPVSLTDLLNTLSDAFRISKREMLEKSLWQDIIRDSQSNGNANAILEEIIDLENQIADR